MMEKQRGSKALAPRLNWGPFTVIILVCATSRFTVLSRTAFAYDKPVHFALSTLLSLSLLATTAVTVLQCLTRTSLLRTLPAQLRQSRKPISAFIVATCIRIVIFKRVVLTSQCSQVTLSTFLPLGLALFDFYHLRNKAGPIKLEAPGSPNSSVRYQRIYLVALALFGLGAYVMQNAAQAPRSTFVCPAKSWSYIAIPLLQHLGVYMELIMIRSFTYMVSAGYAVSEDRFKARCVSLSLVAFALSVSAALLASHGVVWYLFVPEDRLWTVSVSPAFFGSVVNLNFYICTIAAAALICGTYYGYTATVFVLIASSAFTSAFSIGGSFLPVPFFQLAFGLIVTCAGIWLYGSNYVATQESFDAAKPNTKNRLRLILALGFIVSMCLGLTTQTNRAVSQPQHPIDGLIEDAKIKHIAWSKQASSSSSIAEAATEYRRRYHRHPPPGCRWYLRRYSVAASSSSSIAEAATEYRRRYHRHPPPGFDKWYNFATNKKSKVIDDFDGIVHGLAPFEHLSPLELRNRTWEAIANNKSDISGLMIRGGRAKLSPTVLEADKLMMQALVEMIQPFEEHLPDMDIAFNTNDGPRVAMSRSPIFAPGAKSALLDLQSPPKYGNFSTNRLTGWAASQGSYFDPEKPSPFKDVKVQQIFHDYGVDVCPSSSPASTNFHWDNSRLCTDCVSSYSSGIFLANWTLSKQICAQPDLARLHGFYAGPSTFKGTHELYPIFSPSRAPYFADILYPSAWNYKPQAEYNPNTEAPDPSFRHKTPALFWRGATTEGASTGSSAWQGFMRQRFYHLLNTASGPQLLSLPTSSNMYKYTHVSLSRLRKSISTIFSFVAIPRCGGSDCGAQRAEFGPMAEPMDFQSHWGYKYLLDLDGAGSSSRFLPFLHSGSLPFKATLYREWYDDRVIAWRHFVPVDIRGHGLWGTLAYFAGFEGKGAHENEAEEIAGAGSDLAAGLLRKEDMEVYMFRLLLEWGRMTDDMRLDIGYAG